MPSWLPKTHTKKHWSCLSKTTSLGWRKIRFIYSLKKKCLLLLTMTPTSNWNQILFYFRPSLMAMEMFILYSTWADLLKNGFSRVKSGSLFSRIRTLLLSEVFLFCWVFLLKKTSTLTHWEFLENLEKLSVQSHLWFTRKPSKRSPSISSITR